MKPQSFLAVWSLLFPKANSWFIIVTWQQLFYLDLYKESVKCFLGVNNTTTHSHVTIGKYNKYYAQNLNYVIWLCDYICVVMNDDDDNEPIVQLISGTHGDSAESWQLAIWSRLVNIPNYFLQSINTPIPLREKTAGSGAGPTPISKSGTCHPLRPSFTHKTAVKTNTGLDFECRSHRLMGPLV